MGPSSGSYIVAADPRRLPRAKQPSLQSLDSNETHETSTIGRSETSGLHGTNVGIHPGNINVHLTRLTSHEYESQLLISRLQP